MKIHYSKITIGLFFMATLIVFVACSSKKNIAKESSEFFVTAQTEANNKVTLTCTEGCAWKTLSYTPANENVSQAIDEYGMANLKNINENKDANLSSFLFTVQKNGDRIILEGLEGTAWTELSFITTPYKPQGIDKMGMAGN